MKGTEVWLVVEDDPTEGWVTTWLVGMYATKAEAEAAARRVATENRAGTIRIYKDTIETYQQRKPWQRVNKIA